MPQPANPNDRSLLSSIFICADEQAHDRAKDILQMFGLPEAEEGEFFSGANVDRIYLNTHGLCLSFVYRHPNVIKQAFSRLLGQTNTLTAPVFEARKLVDERILQPLLQVDLGPNCCFEIVPGVERVGASEQDVARLAVNLMGDGINFYNREPEFVGLLRERGGDQAQVIVNRRAVKRMSSYMAEDDGSAGLQEKIHGPLRSEMQAAFDSARGAETAKVLIECARIASLDHSDPAKILHAHWKEAGPHTARRKTIVAAADEYQRRLTV